MIEVRAALVSAAIVTLLLGIGCSGDGGGSDDDAAGDGDSDSDGGSDGDSDSDSDSDGDGGTDTETATEQACEGECEQSLYTACTCGTADPCGWAEDGYCDGYCVEGGVVDEMFDDSVDCDETCSGLCQEIEWTVYYVPCTCGADDPCEWAENGVCDEACLAVEGVEEMFDDTVDCDGDAGVDAG